MWFNRSILSEYIPNPSLYLLLCHIPAPTFSFKVQRRLRRRRSWWNVAIGYWIAFFFPPSFCLCSPPSTSSSIHRFIIYFFVLFFSFFFVHGLLFCIFSLSLYLTWFDSCVLPYRRSVMRPRIDTPLSRWRCGSVHFHDSEIDIVFCFFPPLFIVFQSVLLLVPHFSINIQRVKSWECCWRVCPLKHGSRMLFFF